MRIGYVGLGDQGGPIARRLLAQGLPVTVWARRTAALEPFRNTPASIAPDLAALAAESDVVGVCVTDDAAVEAVTGPQLLDALRPGTTIVVQSTVLPATCVQLAERAARHGVHVIDVPVSGGSGGALRGQLALMAGGDPAIIAACRPMLDAMGTVIETGPLGTGQVAKLANQLVFAANLGAAVTVLNRSDGLGLVDSILRPVFATASCRSWVIESLPRLADPGFVEHAIMLLAKDLLLARETFRASGGADALVDVALHGLQELRAYSARLAGVAPGVA